MGHYPALRRRKPRSADWPSAISGMIGCAKERASARAGTVRRGKFLAEEGVAERAGDAAVAVALVLPEVRLAAHAAPLGDLGAASVRLVARQDDPGDAQVGEQAPDEGSRRLRDVALSFVAVVREESKRDLGEGGVRHP